MRNRACSDSAATEMRCEGFATNAAAAVVRQPHSQTFHEGRAPHNKGLRYPPDPRTVAEIISVMRAAGDDADGVRLRALIIVLWRAGLRISEALALAETDLDPVRGAVLVRQGKGGKRREVGKDRWAWEQLEPWSSSERPCRWERSSASCRGRHEADAVALRGPRATAPHGRGRSGQTPLRAPSAAARPRGQGSCISLVGEISCRCGSMV